MNLTELDWIGAVPWLLGGLLASLALRQAILQIMLMRLRFEAGRSDIVPRERLPRSVREILNTAAPALAPLGHEYRYSLVLWTGLTEARDRPVYADVYAHASAHAHAWVMPAQAPETGALCTVEFLTCLADGRTLVTPDPRSRALPPLPPDWTMHACPEAALAERWSAHRERAGHPGGGRTVDDPLVVRHRVRRLQAGWIRYLESRGMACPAGRRGTWRLTLRGALAMAMRARTAGAHGPGPAVEQAANASRVRMLADAFAFSRRFVPDGPAATERTLRLVLHAGAGLAGGLLLGAEPSWPTGLALALAMLLHEAGHRIAARSLGGGDAERQFAVPRFRSGAAAHAWQSAAVSLAGPLPGLVLGAFALYFGGGADAPVGAWAGSFGAVAVAVNLFSLLPLRPLDGGRIADALLFVRFPRLQVFAALATGALVAGAGVRLEDGLLILLGAVVAGLALIQSEVARTAAAVRKAAGSAEPKRLLRSAFAVLAKSRPRLAFRRRAEIAGRVLALLGRRLPAPAESAAGLAAYAAVLVLPVVLLVAVPPSTDAGTTAGAPGRQSAGTLVRDWEAELGAAATFEGQWQVLYDAGRWYEGRREPDPARSYYGRALDLAAMWPPQDPRALDNRLALARLADDPAESLRLYREILDGLRASPQPDPLRLAEAMEAIHYLDGDAPDADRIARLREAVAARESGAGGFDGRLHGTRRELAWLLDRSGDAAGAEMLLRRNAEDRGAPPDQAAAALVDLAWFVIARQQPQQAEELLTGTGAQSVSGDRQVGIALAWARLLQGKAAEGASVLEALWKNPQPAGDVGAKLDLVLDLAAASRLRGDAAGEAEWLERGRGEMRNLPAESAQDLRGRYEVPAEGWDAVRRQKQGELAKLL